MLGNDSASSNITSSRSLKLTYNGTDFISLENAIPGSTDSMTFSVKNTGTLPVSAYQIFFSKLTNTFINNEIVYTLTCLSSDAVSCSGVSQTPVPISEVLVIEQGSIAPNTTHTYSLTVLFRETNSDQNYNQDQDLYFTITINEMKRVSQTLIARQTYNSTELFWSQANNITEITFEDKISIPSEVTSWDVSANQDNKIMAYIIDDGLGTNTYHLHIQSDGQILGNQNSRGFFFQFDKLNKINNFDKVDTSNVKDMSYMFGNCYKLTSLDLSSINTSNVTDMEYMIGGCYILPIIDLSSFNTSKVTNMSYMFTDCSELLSIDVSTFDTSNVITMQSMFTVCEKITSLDLSQFNTSKVTTMRFMFNWCSSLSSLDISQFNTSQVVDMWGMFRECSDLTSLDLSTFNMNSVTNAGMMFNNCISLTTLDLRNSNFTTVSSYSSMFLGITNGITITVLDTTAQTWITSRLSDAGKTGTVVIA